VLKGWSAAAVAAALIVGPVAPATATGSVVDRATPPPVLSAVDLGPIVQNPHVLFRDGLESTEFHGASVWTFGDTGLNAPNAEGSNWDDNSLAYTTDLDGADGLTLPHDAPESAQGVPGEYLPFTRAEQAFNAAHSGSGGDCRVKPCGEQIALWNGPEVADPAEDRILFFYYELERGAPGQQGWKSIGEGIATWTPGHPVERPIESPGAKVPTLMFGPDAINFSNAALAVGDMMYAYGCTGVAVACDLARVPLADALDHADWRYYTADGTWSPDVADAVPVVHGGSAGSSVYWVPYLHEYQEVYMPPLSNEIVERVAPEPWGPWSAATEVMQTLPPAAGDVDYAGMAHPEFAQNDGRIQYVAYYHPLGPFSGEDRWVQITFGNPGSR